MNRTSAENYPSSQEEQIATIAGVSTDGRGVAHIGGRAIFVDRALPGDTVRIRADWSTQPPSAAVLEQLVASPDRVAHPCPHAQECPACPFGNWGYAKQLAAKTDLVRRTLSKVLEKLDVQEISPSLAPWGYRNRVSLRLWQEHDRISIGYRLGTRTETCVPISTCKLAMPDVDQCIGELQLSLSEYRGGGMEKLPTRIQVHQTSAGAGLMIVFPIRIHSSQRKLWRNWLVGTNIPGGVWFATGNRAGVIGSKSWVEPDQAAEPMLTSWMGVPLKVHSGSFCQANAAAAEQVCKRIAVWAGKYSPKVIWDLYGGYGALGFAAGGRSSVVNIIESSKWSEPAAGTLARTAQCKKMSFIHGDVLREFSHHSSEVSDQDLVILDPPTSGAHREVLDLLIESSARRICYLSCNPARLARDLRILSDGGFRTTEIQPYDFFPQTASIEVLALLDRR
jgi:23S rRNA (uracil1939-C5)-methyltransferase